MPTETQQAPQPSPAPEPPHTPRQSTWRTVFEVIGGVASGIGKLFSLLFYLFIFLALFGGNMFGGGDSGGPTVLWGDGDDAIAMIDISGTIMDEDQGGGFGQTAVSTPRHLIQIFEEIKKQDNVKAVVLRVNSPGGTVTASEEIYQIIKDYREILNVPIIASMSDVAASGGYYISVATDHIVANSSTLTGSIGVIFQTMNFEELATEYGIKNVVVKSGENKDLLNPLEPVSEDQIAILQSLVDESYEQFLQRILDNRPIERPSLLEVADGRVLSGQQALSWGLIDSLGTTRDAVEFAAQNAGTSNYKVVVYGEKGLLESLLGAMSSSSLLGNVFPQTNAMSMMSGKPAYLWAR